MNHLCDLLIYLWRHSCFLQEFGDRLDYNSALFVPKLVEDIKILLNKAGKLFSTVAIKLGLIRQIQIFYFLQRNIFFFYILVIYTYFFKFI